MPDAIAPSLERIIHDLADAILKQANRPQPSRVRFDVTYATITAINAAAHTVTINVAGDSTNVTGISYLGSYSPTVGDMVLVLHHGHDFVVLGAIAPEGIPSQLHSWAVAGSLAAATLPGFIAYVPEGSAMTIVTMRGVLGAGTVTAALLVNGSAAATLNVTTTVSSLLTVGASLSDGDVVTLQLSAPSGASDLTLTLNGF